MVAELLHENSVAKYGESAVGRPGKGTTFNFEDIPHEQDQSPYRTINI
jgi:hypothetical protein